MAAEYSVASEAQEAKEAVTSVLTITTQKPKDATSQAEKTTTFPANSDANTTGGLILISFFDYLSSNHYPEHYITKDKMLRIIICHLFWKILIWAKVKKPFWH